jgi:hypothetical protein
MNSTSFLLFLNLLSLSAALLPSISAYAGHPDGIMRGNRQPNPANSKYSSPVEEKRSLLPSKAARLSNGIPCPATRQHHESHHTERSTTYFEELWGDVKPASQVKLPSKRILNLKIAFIEILH